MRKCPFPFCPRQRFEGHFACRGHWWRMSAEMQREAICLMRKKDHDDIADEKYREMRDDIVARCPGAFMPAPLFMD